MINWAKRRDLHLQYALPLSWTVLLLSAFGVPAALAFAVPLLVVALFPVLADAGKLGF